MADNIEHQDKGQKKAKGLGDSTSPHPQLTCQCMMRQDKQSK